MPLLLKENVYQQVQLEIATRIANLKLILNEMFDAAAGNDAKSSAGDKHETGIAMAQLEQEKLTHQINELLKLQASLQKINPLLAHTKVGLGSLVETNNGWYYFSVGLGPIKIDGISLFALNPQAPIGALLLGKTIGDKVQFNGKTTEVLSIQ
jgi:transcription elongation GreA/GreB family factor